MQNSDFVRRLVCSRVFGQGISQRSIRLLMTRDYLSCALVVHDKLTAMLRGKLLYSFLSRVEVVRGFYPDEFRFMLSKNIVLS